ncbi:HAD hydrolase family protein [Azospirillum sp. 11R-A]|uniref:HAD family hydrolase n=1 Tax=Azospirillum sp. 11R-A TaxID=3111634 RepID=UPI003C290D3A
MTIIAALRPLAKAPAEALARVRFVLTDMDDTLTHRGRLSARTYDAIERLRDAGLPVLPVTAAPAGWADQMARMWPVDGVIAENGGLFLRRTADGDVECRYWHGEEERTLAARRLEQLRQAIHAVLPEVKLVSDQPFRLCSLAFRAPSDPALRTALVRHFRNAGAEVTVNSLWVLGWFGGYDKLGMARRVMREVHGLDIDAVPEAVAYAGDSVNDAPMFAHFPTSVGVSTVIDFLSDIPRPPAWITRGPGGDGFVELADALLAARTPSPFFPEPRSAGDHHEP